MAWYGVAENLQGSVQLCKLNEKSVTCFQWGAHDRTTRKSQTWALEEDHRGSTSNSYSATNTDCGGTYMWVTRLSLRICPMKSLIGTALAMWISGTVRGVLVNLREGRFSSTTDDAKGNLSSQGWCLGVVLVRCDTWTWSRDQTCAVRAYVTTVERVLANCANQITTRHSCVPYRISNLDHPFNTMIEMCSKNRCVPVACTFSATHNCNSSVSLFALSLSLTSTL